MPDCRSACFCLAVLAAACGGSSSDPDASQTGADAPTGSDGAAADAPVVENCPTTGRYLSLATGYSWTYRVVDTMTGQVTQKVQVVGPLEDISAIHPGVSAYKLTTTKPGGTTDSWQEDTGTSIRRHSEHDNSGGNTTVEQYDPFRTRLDGTPAHTSSGATWDEAYTEIVSQNGNPATTTAKVESWTVVAVDEPVAVPAGTFCALHLHRTSSVGGGAGSDKDYWFAREVGKIKETGAGQTEELSAFTR